MNKTACYKGTLIFLSLLIFSTSYGQKKNLKGWDEADPLQWSDFQGTAIKFVRYTAVVYTTVNYTYEVLKKDSGYVFKFNVTCNMLKDISWTKRESDEILKHEQVHFDIAEFFARQLYTVFNKRNFTENYKEEIKYLAKSVNGQRQKMQRTYDEQTNHGVYRQIQAVWEKYIQDLLSNNYTLIKALEKQPVFY